MNPTDRTAATPPVANAPWVIFAVASVAVFLVSIDTTVLYAAFGALRVAFPAARAADLSWVLNAYTVVFAALLVPAGRLADFLAMALRYHARLIAYHLSLVERYPSLDQEQELEHHHHHHGDDDIAHITGSPAAR